MYKLEFPELKWIKNHKRHPDPKRKDEYAEYEWNIFHIGNSYCRIKYNEDDNGKLYLDMMQGGYIDVWEPFGHTKSYKANIAEYKKLQEDCEFVYNKLINQLINSNTLHKEYWE